MFGLRISRLMLAEIFVSGNVYWAYQYLQRRCCRNFKDLDMTMLIYLFKRMIILIEDLRNLGPLQLVSEPRI